MTGRRSVVAGCGGYLPQNILTNDELAQRIDTSDEWIRDRSGIEMRHIAAEGEMTSDLATAAAQSALNAAGLAVEDLGLILLATSTPEFCGCNRRNSFMSSNAIRLRERPIRPIFSQ